MMSMESGAGDGAGVWLVANLHFIRGKSANNKIVVRGAGVWLVANLSDGADVVQWNQVFGEYGGHLSMVSSSNGRTLFEHRGLEDRNLSFVVANGATRYSTVLPKPNFLGDCSGEISIGLGSSTHNWLVVIIEAYLDVDSVAV